MKAREVAYGIGGTEGRFARLDAALEQLRERSSKVPPALVREFAGRLEISWIYHDSALEGVVLTYSEIKAAIDKNIISDISLIPSYQDVKQFKEAIDWTNEYAANRKRPINTEVVRKIYSILTPEEAPALAFRKENPLHRLYYHEISMPDRILQRMRKLGDWLEEDGVRRLHPVERAARAHFQLMSIFPWTKNSGKVARILANMILARDGYPPAIIHSVDRQRYYEVLRGENMGVVPLYLEAALTSVETALKFYDEATATVLRRRAAS
ncbi:MAG: Fic family protein [Pseudomonadota bacterium]